MIVSFLPSFCLMYSCFTFFSNFLIEGIRALLLDSEEQECPQCHTKAVSPDTLIPNRFLRTAVTNFRSETGYTKVTPIVAVEPAPSVPEPVPEIKEDISDEKEEPELILEVRAYSFSKFCRHFM